MSERISLSLSPVFHWAVLLAVALALVALTLWPYFGQIRDSRDRRKWLVVGLRLAAVFLALLASVRPSLLILQRVRQRVAVIFLVDRSTSMTISDEVNNQRRWDVALQTLEGAGAALDDRDEGIDVKTLMFDSQVVSGPIDGSQAEPAGRATALGSALTEAVAREAGGAIAGLILLSDGASNQGLAPMTAARNLRSQGVPVTAVGLGSTAAGAGARDLAVTGIQAPESVFVKNELQVRGSLRARGFAGQELEVELRAEGLDYPVDRATIRAPEDAETVTTGTLTYVPQVSGDRLLTLSVKPKDGELLESNNTYSTFVTVLPGGLNVLHLQGPGTIWEGKYVTLSLDQSREIESDLRVLLGPPGDGGGLEDEEFATGARDVYILGNVPADFLSANQHRLLAESVRQGAGLIMLGGRDSLGDGGWGDTPIGQLMPTTMRRGDGQVEPEGGLKVVPNLNGLDSYVLQVGATPEETRRLWEALPPISGANRLGSARRAAIVWAELPNGEPLIVAQDVGQGRVIAFGGETWPWYRAGGTAQAVHRRFWRQAVLWLAHQEDRASEGVTLELDRRRVPVGGRVLLNVVARDEQNQPIPEVEYEAEIELPNGESATVELFNRSEGAGGGFEAPDETGVYDVSVVARRPDGSEIGRASSRFLVYEDDRELANPAADIALLEQIAATTDGAFLRPEQLEDFLAALDPETASRAETQVEYRLWDNWPFLILFVSLLGMEWWLRKRMGWA